MGEPCGGIVVDERGLMCASYIGIGIEKGVCSSLGGDRISSDGEVLTLGVDGVGSSVISAS